MLWESAELGRTVDPKILVPGDSGAIQNTIDQLHKFASAFGETAHGLTAVDTEHWQGPAADAFRAKFQTHPKLWSAAQDACTKAASELGSYRSTLTWAQGQAQKAITLYMQAQQSTQQAQQTYDQQVDAYNGQPMWAGTNGVPMLPKPGPFVDPGAGDKAQAQDILDRARAQMKTVAEQSAAAITQATNTAPQKPDFWSRVGADASDLVGGTGIELSHFEGGMVEGMAGIVATARTLNPLDPFNMTHPAEYVDGLSSTAAGLLHTTEHPLDLVTGLVGSGWGSDPAEAFGKLIPNLALAAATDGAGAEADEAETGAEQATQTAAQRDAANTTTRPPTEPPASAPASPAPHEMDTPAGNWPTGADNPDHWGDFGPQGSPEANADQAATGDLNNAGGGLGQVDHDLGNIHVGQETAPSSAVPDTTGPAGHLDSPPTVHSSGPDGGAAPPAPGGGLSDLQRRLDGLNDPTSEADQQAARDITNSGTGLNQVDHDLDQIHVRDEPIGPEHNNPDYNDRQYEAGPGARRAYERKYPRRDQKWLDQVRREHPDVTAKLTDQEIFALKRMTREDYADINEALRTGDQAALNKLDPEIRNAASALNKLNNYGGRVLRGIAIKPKDLEKFLERYQEKQEVTEWAFTHTDKEVPHEGNIQFVIDGGTGKDVSWLVDSHVGQQEVMYPPGSKFIVDRVYRREGTGQWIIVLRGLK